MWVVIPGAKSADLIVFFCFQCAQIKWQNGEWTKGILSSRNCDFGAQFFKTMQSWVLALVEHCLSFECENTYQPFLTKFTLLICDLSLKRFTYFWHIHRKTVCYWNFRHVYKFTWVTFCSPGYCFHIYQRPFRKKISWYQYFAVFKTIKCQFKKCCQFVIKEMREKLSKI